MKNLIVDDSALPTGQVLKGVTLTQCMQQAVEVAGWTKKEVKIR